MKINPYTKLLNDIKKFLSDNKFRHQATMWVYPKAQLQDKWRLSELAERVCAAEQLGYDVFLENVNEGLRVRYRKKELEIPYEWRY